MNRQLRVVLSFLLVLGLALPISALAQAPAPGQIRGILLTTEGLPAEGFQISAKAANGDLFNSTMSGPDGRFVVPGLPPGTYELVALGPDGAEYPIVGGPVAVEAGQTQRLELQVAELGAAPGRDPNAVRKVQDDTDSDRRRGAFWSSTTGRVIMIVGGLAGAALIYDAVDDDDEESRDDDPSPSEPR